MATVATKPKAGELWSRRLVKAMQECEKEGGVQRNVWNKQQSDWLSNFSVKDLLEDDYIFGGVGGRDIWDCHKADIIELWERRRTEGVSLFIDQEGIGSGKTTKAGAITALLLLEILTTWDIRKIYSVQHPIVLIAMSRTLQQSREITFDSMLKFCSAPIFMDYFLPNISRGDINPETGKISHYPKFLRFPGRVHVFPGSGDALGTLGFDIYGATVDEANYLEVVEGSKRAVGGDKVFDAAKILFEEIHGRIQSRFSIGGKVKGLLTMISNSRYVGDFFHRVIEMVEKGIKTEDALLPPTMVRRRATWDALPKEKMTGEFFLFDKDKMEVLD